jgi:integrase
MNAVLVQHNKMHAHKTKVVSFATQRARDQILTQCFVKLHKNGFKLLDVHGLRTRHVKYLVDSWVKEELMPGTIQTRLSYLRTFCEWINKKGMIPSTDLLVPKEFAVRNYVTKVDKSWSGQGVDFCEAIKRVEVADPFVAIQLRMQLGFALRSQESWLLRPELADCQTHLAVRWGTKGGRDRVVPIDSDEKRDLINQAKVWANKNSGSLIPVGYTLKTWRRHYYYITTKCELTRAKGAVPHGLRHQAAIALYESITGVQSPVRHGEGFVKPANDEYARQVVAETTGHSRPQITSAYLGGSQTSKLKS